LLNHIVPGTYFSGSLRDNQLLITGAERDVHVGLRNGTTDLAILYTSLVQPWQKKTMSIVILYTYISPLFFPVGKLREVGISRVLESDIPATNGVIHVMDRVLRLEATCFS
jgi:hypothetical protein